MSGQAPQWLVSAVTNAFRQVGATGSQQELEREARSLVALWSAPDRPAHNAKYLSNLLERLSDFSDVTTEPAVLKLTAAYLVTSALTTWEALGGWRSNRVQTGPPVAQRLEAIGVPQQTATRIQDLVEQLSSSSVPTDDFNAQIMFDAILELLGTSPQRYAKFRELLREEAGAQDERSFLEARRKFIKAVLGRPRVFTTPFAAEWADAVRENLQGELVQIDALLGDEGNLDHGADVDLLGTGTQERREDAVLFRGSPHAQVSAETVPTPKRNSVARRSMSDRVAQKPEAESEGSRADDTSTLEAFDDPFSHRRGKRS